MNDELEISITLPIQEITGKTIVRWHKSPLDENEVVVIDGVVIHASERVFVVDNHDLAQAVIQALGLMHEGYYLD